MFLERSICFFNHDVQGGFKLDWKRDYYCFAPAQLRRKAPEILISLEITPPSTFKNATPVVWTKIWRSSGLYYDSLSDRSATDIGARSKMAAYMRAIRFDYVPAIKGQITFKY